MREVYRERARTRGHAPSRCYSPNALENPLLSLENEIPFDRIRAEHVEPAIATLVARTNGALNELEHDQAEPTYARTLGRPLLPLALPGTHVNE